MINNINNFKDGTNENTLNEIKEKIIKTEKQLSEIAHQIQSISENLSNIQTKLGYRKEELITKKSLEIYDDEKLFYDSENKKSDKQEEKNIEKYSKYEFDIEKEYSDTINYFNNEKNSQIELENIKRYNDYLRAMNNQYNENSRRKGRRYQEKNKSRTEDNSRDVEFNSKLNKIKEKQMKVQKSTKYAWIGDLIFYTCLIAMVVGAFIIRTNSSGHPISIAGYSFFTVLTTSMQDEIPQGSLVIAKNVDPATLKIGDDITFMANETTTVTHRIIEITEKYKDTEKRAFTTKGTMNERADKQPVPEVNVIGKVVYHNELVGNIMGYVEKNWIFLLFVFVIIITFGGVMHKVLKDDE